MQKWEYMVKESKDLSQGDFFDLCRFFDNWNNGDWELVSVDNGIAYFKRPVPEMNIFSVDSRTGERIAIGTTQIE